MRRTVGVKLMGVSDSRIHFGHPPEQRVGLPGLYAAGVDLVRRKVSLSLGFYHAADAASPSSATPMSLRARPGTREHERIARLTW